MKKRWISILVENEIGVLARIVELFSSKSYNLDSLSVGVSEDPTMSRMTICLTSDDQTFEQAKKQLYRCVEVIKVFDLTNQHLHKKEIMYIKLHEFTKTVRNEIIHLLEQTDAVIMEETQTYMIIESIQDAEKNDELIKVFHDIVPFPFEIIRGGSVAIKHLR